MGFGHWNIFCRSSDYDSKSRIDFWRYGCLDAAFLFFHNILYGLSAGLLFLTPLKECHRFFPKLKLITNSIVLSGTGLGAVLFGAGNIECIERDNETVILSENELKLIVDEQFSGCFMRTGIYLFLVGIVGLLMMIPMILRNEDRCR